MQFPTKFLSSWTGLLDFCINVTIRTINHQWIWMNESILLWCCVRMASSLFPCSLAILRTQGVALWWSSKPDQLYITLDLISFLFKAVEGAGGAHWMEVLVAIPSSNTSHITPCHTAPIVAMVFRVNVVCFAWPNNCYHLHIVWYSFKWLTSTESSLSVSVCPCLSEAVCVLMLLAAPHVF